MLPTFEWLFSKFKCLFVQYKDHLDSHFRNCIQLGWDKLDEYYKHLDDTPVYLAALVLHPQYKWYWIEKKWSERPGWIKKGKKAVEKLWKKYKVMEVPTLAKQAEQKPKKEKSRLSTFIDTNFSNDEVTNLAVRDKYNEWCKL